MKRMFMPASFSAALLITSLVIFIFYNFAFIFALLKKRNDIADIAWGIGFLIATICPLFLYGIHSQRSIIATALIFIWSTRLSLHIYKRNSGKTEDYRYLAWRNEWGRYFYIRTYLQVFLLQAIFLIIIVTPVLLINSNQRQGITWLDLIGIAVWIFGFIFETIADHQLATFLSNSNNQGLILTKGLWHYSRHPNYFGEITLWWGFFILALSVKGGIFSIISPITITYLIIKVSGIPLLEKKMAENTVFKKYKEQTSALIPWMRKNQ